MRKLFGILRFLYFGIFVGSTVLWASAKGHGHEDKRLYLGAIEGLALSGMFVTNVVLK